MSNNGKNDLYLFYINADKKDISEIEREIESFNDCNNKGNLNEKLKEQNIFEEFKDIKFKKIFIIVVDYEEIDSLYNKLKVNVNKELYTSLNIIIFLKDQSKYESLKNNKINYEYNYPFFNRDFICKDNDELKDCLQYGRKKIT
jgi:hypothetical protein